MRRPLLLAGAAALALSAGLASGAVRPAQTHAASGVSQFCTTNGANIGFMTQGACVSYFETMTGSGFPKSSGYIAAYCSMFTYPGYIYDPYAQQQVFERNQGKCVTYANNNYKA